MGITYFKRFRMELDLDRVDLSAPAVEPPYRLIGWSERAIRDHARAKYASFREEMDATIFPCLARLDGCLRLMKDLAARDNFVPEATWLITHQPDRKPAEPIGTIQGLSVENWGAIQNLGIAAPHRGHGLGAVLLARAAAGFRQVGLQKMHLEVTTDNTAAIRFYQRLGFRKARTVFKAVEIESA